MSYLFKNKSLIYRGLIIISLIIGLILVRYYEEQLFYDPLLSYFKDNEIGRKLPNINQIQLFSSIFLRYLINSIFSILILYFIFYKKKIMPIIIKIYSVTFIILYPIYDWMILNDFPFGKTLFFYIRRILIQPFLLLLLIPAIYFYQLNHKKHEN